jgi:VCBS repeat-containing protein
MPTFSSTLNRWVRRESITLKSSGAQTASTNGTAVETTGGSMSLTLAVTAASGTNPTLDITIQGSDDGTTFYTLGTFAQKTGVASEKKAFEAPPFVRYASTIGGTDTPSFTYSILGTVA